MEEFIDTPNYVGSC